MNGYELTRAWFDFSFENPDIVKSTHGIVYLWQVELCNRLGWPEKFSSPASECMRACNMKSYNTYKPLFDDLVKWGFIEIKQESKNQYTANVIALSNIDKAPNKALDKSLAKHMTTHLQSTCESISESTCDIIKQETINQKPINLINSTEENAETSSAPLENIPVENFESKIISLPAEKGKRKKVAQKKESDPYTAAMKIIYVRKFPDVYYAAKEATNMKQLSEKLFMGFKIKHDNRMPTVEEIEESFQYLMDNLPQWMLDKGFITPSDINSQFEKVKAELLGQKRNSQTQLQKRNEELFAAVHAQYGN